MSLLKPFVARLSRKFTEGFAPLKDMAERSLIMQAQALARTNRDLNRLPSLAAVEFRAFSQFGEDGIVDWLIERLPDIPRNFVEFGVQNYRESNTRLLLQLRNWRGLVLDGAAENIADIRRQDISWRHDLTAVCAFIDKDNINTLLERAKFAGPIGLLSIDVDGNDYWIWHAIGAVSPAVVICEYNAVLGDRHSLTVPYRADFDRSAAHHSNLYFGASLPALAGLARRKGYAFAGTTSSGCNAFFVRDDLAPHVLSVLDQVLAYPSAVRESRDAAGQLTFARGPARKAIIEGLPLLDVQSGSLTTLADRELLYSPEWTDGRPVRWR
jgi:hypothetical protein